MIEHAMGWSYSEPTLTKRELFAAMAMQGIVSNSEDWNRELLTKESVKIADALIEALNEPKDKP